MQKQLPMLALKCKAIPENPMRPQRPLPCTAILSFCLSSLILAACGRGDGGRVGTRASAGRFRSMWWPSSPSRFR